VEIVTLRLTATGRFAHGTPERTAPHGARPPAMRPVFVAGGWRDTPVRPRSSLTAPLCGPAMIEEDYTTIFVAPGWRCAPGPHGMLVATRDAS
jgi:N-methylhydantoinase A